MGKFKRYCHKEIFACFFIVVLVLTSFPLIEANNLTMKSSKDRDSKMIKGSLEGYITDPAGNALENVFIKIRGIHNYTGYTDENGFYFIDNITLMYCAHGVCISLDEYHSECFPRTISPGSRHNFTLYPEFIYMQFNEKIADTYWWYKEPVQVSFCFDEILVSEIYVDNEFYDGPFIVDEMIDGFDWYYVDSECCIHGPYNCFLRIDCVAPEISLSYEITGNLFTGKYVTLSADVCDQTSGVYSVSFYIDSEDVYPDEEIETIYEPPFESTRKFNESVRGHTIKATARDMSSNSERTEITLPWFSSLSYEQNSFSFNKPFFIASLFI